MAEGNPEGLEALFALLPELYAPVDAEQFPQRLVRLIEKLIPCWNVGFNEVDFLRGQTTGVVSSANFDLDRWLPIFDAHVGDHPLIRHYQQHPEDTRVLRFCDVTTTAEFHRTGIYNEFFRPLGQPYQMGLTLRAGPCRVIGVGVSRGERDFSEAECRLLAALRPHVLRAYQNAKALTRQRKILETCRHALDESNAALIAVENGRVTLVTARAQRLLSKYFPGLRVRAGATLPDELRRPSAPSPTDAAARSGAVATPTVVLRGAEELRVRQLPGRLGGETLWCLEEKHPGSPQQLQSLGLTAREAEVSFWLLYGKSNPEIALIARMSVRTVEKHLERIYVKLGVENRVAATLHLLRLVGGTPDR
ncbi:MAG TPA: LuxR C-terminal-related transcriptional regulator [Verrucomicrobiae bacterium]|nr:LuxR C-terminal-related transcriptional regulator [Verrucomicrobiae bacterium]